MFRSGGRALNKELSEFSNGSVEAMGGSWSAAQDSKHPDGPLYASRRARGRAFVRGFRPLHAKPWLWYSAMTTSGARWLEMARPASFSFWRPPIPLALGRRPLGSTPGTATLATR